VPLQPLHGFLPLLFSFFLLLAFDYNRLNRAFCHTNQAALAKIIVNLCFARKLSRCRDHSDATVRAKARANSATCAFVSYLWRARSPRAGLVLAGRPFCNRQQFLTHDITQRHKRHTLVLQLLDLSRQFSAASAAKLQ